MINHKSNIITIANLFTFARVLLAPCIVRAMLIHAWLYAFIFFTIAALTDLVDGALARFLQEETTVGAYLDPVADKLLLISCYATLGFVESPLFIIPHWFVIIVLIKEFLLMGAALYLSSVAQLIEIRPTLLGKITTLVQVLFIWFLFACSYFHWLSADSMHICFIIIALLMITTLIHYGYTAYKKVEHLWLKKS
jgi:cardiolipin synthase (CMP-forming)